MKKLALAVVATVIGLVMAEGVLRLTGLGTIQPEIQFGEITGAQLESGFFIFDKDLFWREPEGVPDQIHLGNHFVRVGDVFPSKERRLRILCLGDSCTRLSRTNQPFSVRLQAALGPNAEVFNASLPGYTSHQGLAWLNKQLLASKPDVVVVYFGWNDHWRSWGLPDHAYARSLSFSSSRLLNLVRPRPAIPPIRLLPDEYRENLNEMARLITGQGGKMVLVLAPHNINRENTAHYRKNGNITEGDDPKALHLTYLEIARDAGTQPGVRMYDAAAQFAAIAEPRLILQRDGIHPTDPGHQILARSLADDITRHDLGAPGPSVDPVAMGLSVLAQESSFSGEWETALRLFGRSVSLEPAGVGQRLGLAWLLATCPEATVRDGIEALVLLEPVAGFAGQSAQFLDVQAAAMAETGRFEEAIRTLDQALEFLSEQGGGQSEFARSIRDRQEGYRSGKAFRTPAPSG
jgi:lysophospholipase L1-like esterase